jgi:ubiquinone/menaquinone biosynthesis C-methylase UbiE
MRANTFEKEYYEANSFWEGEMLQDAANNERFDITANLIPAAVLSILDAGCGNGVFVNHLAKKKPELKIHALDRSETALRFVDTDKTQGDLAEMPFADGSFDCISCLEVLEHLPVDSFKKALAELTRVSKKYLLISVPYNEVLEDSYTKCPNCKAIFNYELHLRSFNDDVFKKLFDDYGYRQIKSVKAGMSENFKFHKSYRKLFYSEQFLRWNSPICPICGFTEKAKANNNQPINHQAHFSQKRKLISYLAAIPKMIWPKEKKYYWIIGLFEKV